VTLRVWHATHVAVSVTPPHFCFLIVNFLNNTVLTSHDTEYTHGRFCG
jgi:hypothetical protein